MSACFEAFVKEWVSQPFGAMSKRFRQVILNQDRFPHQVTFGNAWEHFQLFHLVGSARDTGKHLLMHRTAPHNNELSDSNRASSAQVENTFVE